MKPARTPAMHAILYTADGPLWLLARVVVIGGLMAVVMFGLLGVG